MNETEFSLTINGTTFVATWFPKEDDRVAEWYIDANGERVGKFRGYPSNAKQVENFIRHFLAK